MYQLHLLFDCCIIYCMSYRGLTVHFFGADSWVPTEKVDSWALEPNCSGNQRPTVRGTNLQLSGGPTVRPEKTESFHLKPLYWATRGAKIDKFCNNDRMKHSNVVFIVCSHKLSCLVGGIFEQTTLFGCQQQLSVLVHHHPPSWLAKLVRDILLDEPCCFYGFCMQFRDPPSHILKSIQF